MCHLPFYFKLAFAQFALALNNFPRMSHAHIHQLNGTLAVIGISANKYDVFQFRLALLNKSDFG